MSRSQNQFDLFLHSIKQKERKKRLYQYKKITLKKICYKDIADAVAGLHQTCKRKICLGTNNQTFLREPQSM